ncbi:MAG: DUF3575 domain-containing protein [Candidatus Cryptobacteroides sp.]
MKPWIYYFIVATTLTLQAFPSHAGSSGMDRKVEAKEQKSKSERTKHVKDTTAGPKIAYSKAYADGYLIGIRTNLVRWATLTPDIGIEWRIDKNWSIAADFSYANWNWKFRERNYALWEIAPQARYYFGKNLNWYAGLQAKAGSYNFKASDVGKQGNFAGIGAIGGYKMNLNKSLALDFSLGLGYIYTRCEEYTMINAINVSKAKTDKHWIGPTSIGVTLTWMIKGSKSSGKDKTADVQKVNFQAKRTVKVKK